METKQQLDRRVLVVLHQATGLLELLSSVKTKQWLWLTGMTISCCWCSRIL